MRFFSPVTIIGTLGQIVQAVTSGINALVVTVRGSIFGDDITTALNAFVSQINSIAVAAKVASIQIRNPPASGKTLFIDRLTLFTVGGAVAGDIYQHGRLDAALTNDNGTLPSKYLGQPASVSHSFTDNTAASPLGALMGTILGPGTAGGGVVVQFSPPLRLDAGIGWAMATTSLNTAFRVTAEVREY